MSRKGSSFGNSFSKFILVVSAVGVGLRLLTKGLIDVEKLAIFLVLVVIAAAVDSVWVKLILAFASICFFLLDYTNYNLPEFGAAAIAVTALLICLFGLYVMIGGIRRGK